MTYSNAASAQFDPETWRSLRLERTDSSAERLTTLWPLHLPASLDRLQQLAATDPDAIARWLTLNQSNGDAVRVAHAAEALGVARASERVLPILMLLTRHARPFVREAAIVGMVPHLHLSFEARDRVRAMAAADPSPGVRAVAEEIVSRL